MKKMQRNFDLRLCPCLLALNLCEQGKQHFIKNFGVPFSSHLVQWDLCTIPDKTKSNQSSSDGEPGLVLHCRTQERQQPWAALPPGPQAFCSCKRRTSQYFKWDKTAEGYILSQLIHQEGIHEFMSHSAVFLFTQCKSLRREGWRPGWAMQGGSGSLPDPI